VIVLLTQLSTEDRLIGLSMLMTLVGIILGAIFANPNFIGITAILVIVLLLIGCRFSKSQRLAWLLVFGLSFLHAHRLVVDGGAIRLHHLTPERALVNLGCRRCCYNVGYVFAPLV
jgi:predicted branched-subunit amino acid permease